MGNAHDHVLTKEKFMHDPKRNTILLNRRDMRNRYIESGLPHILDTTFEKDFSQKPRLCHHEDFYYYYYLFNHLNPY